MNYIAGLMLLFLEEEEAYWLLETLIEGFCFIPNEMTMFSANVVVLEDILPPQYYTPNMLDSHVDIHCVFPTLLREIEPKIQ